MHIGFDAKRFFHNPTGLGNYSRTLVHSLAQYFPMHQYFLFNTSPSKQFILPENSTLHQVLPQSGLSKNLPFLWRSHWITKDLLRHKIDLYHGLSHELPFRIAQKGIRSVVTVHDLIFERYPHQYGRYEVQMHRRKIQYACKEANAVIAASNQTKKDLVERYNIQPAKIAVCYQSCHATFNQPAAENIKDHLRTIYQLPPAFFLFVGSIIERKNLMGVSRAMLQIKNQLQLPLVVVGMGHLQKEKILQFLKGNSLESSTLFISEIEDVPELFHLQKPANLAALYQMATALVYPSFFEGFGIPVLEAMCSGLPVITSNISSMPEIGGDAVLYVNPFNETEIATAMLRMQNEANLRSDCSEKGLQQALNFTPQICAAAVMNVYQKIMDSGNL